MTSAASDGPGWGWEDLQAGVRGGDVVRLARNGWQALVAYLAGPDRVRAVGQDRRLVRWSASDGTGGIRPHSVSELDELETDLAEYLAHAGIEQPPPNVEWRLTLPQGLTEEVFWARINSHFDPAAYTRPGAGRETAAALREELAALLG